MAGCVGVQRKKNTNCVMERLLDQKLNCSHAGMLGLGRPCLETNTFTFPCSF